MTAVLSLIQPQGLININEKTKWERYLKRCPKMPLTQFEDGNIFYLKCINSQVASNGKKFIRKAFFAP